MTSYAIGNRELKEFEALLDDKDIYDYELPDDRINTRQTTMNNPDIHSINPKLQKKISFSPKNKSEKNRFLDIPIDEDAKTGFPSNTGIILSSRNHTDGIIITKKPSTAFSSPSLRKNGKFNRIPLPSELDSRQNKTEFLPAVVINKEIRTSPAPELKDLNKDMQRTSFNELLSLYCNSTTEKPTKVFDEKSSVCITTSYMIKKLENPEPKASGVRKSFIFASPRRSHRENIHTMEKEDIVKDAQNTIHDLVDAVQTNTHENYAQSSKYEAQKLELNSWMEMILAYPQLAKVEILAIDLIHFGLLNRIEVPIVNTKFNLDIENALSRVIHETSKTPDNEARHILVYLHEKKGAKKLFLNKYIFIIKNNHPYANGMKREKEIITYYLMILGMFEFKLKYEDKPVTEEKIDAVKTKAFNLIKQNDTSMSASLCEWINSKVKSQLFIEKIYINQDIKGKTDVNFSFNLNEYIASNFPRFLFPNLRPLPGHKKTASFNATNNSQSSFTRESSKSGMRPVASVRNEVHSKEHVFALDAKLSPKRNFTSKRQGDDDDYRLSRSRPRLMSPSSVSQSQMLTSIKSPSGFIEYSKPKTTKLGTSAAGFRLKNINENLKIVNREEFVGLNITKPHVIFGKLTDMMHKSASGFHNRQKNI